VLVAGGMPYPPQILAFSRGVDIVVATPGRLIDLMDRGDADLSRIEITVLDEADHMADLGFLPAVSQILDAVPDNGQRLLFSATLDNAVDRLVRNYLHEPVTHQVDTGQASVPLMSHHLVSIAPQHKTAVTAEIASRPGRTLIFVRTQRGADRVAEQLRRSGVLAGALHGGLAQGARTRIMSAFKHGSLPVLVATDVAARGIHVDEVGLVLHADPPNGPKEYLHRAGRTARAGGTGTVVTFALPHQRHELGRLTTQAGVRPVMLSAIPGDRALAAATGARRASGNAISDAAYQRVIAPPPAQRSHAAHGRRGDGGVRGPARSGRRRAPGSTGARGSRSRHIPD
jgi:superfamily II DNA/RNA helicase